MKITLNRTPEQLTLLANMVSKDLAVRSAARQAFAEFVAKTVQEVIQQASTTAGIYTDLEFDQNSDATIPLDTYYDENAGLFTIWSQTIQGGLPTNSTQGVSELKLQTYSLDSAISFRNQWVEASRLDVVGKSLTRMAQEFMIRQDYNGWVVLLKALANASNRNKKHVIRADTAGVLILDTLNKLLTRAKRINASFNNGTPDPARTRGITDLYVSPEIMEQVRAIAYQPMNTRAGSVATSGATAIPAPESLREQVFRNGGASELYNITLNEINELGVGFDYNNMFAISAGATTYAKSDESGSATFNGATEQILVGVDKTRDALIRPVQVDSVSRGQLTMEEDDSFTKRSGKMGFFGKVEEGRVCLDARALQGLIV